MELDKRIKDRTGIQTCISFDKKYIGKKGFFFDEFCQLIDLKAKCCYGTLIDINETDVANDLCFKATSDKTGYNCFFRFFIPEDNLKPVEKKYRPFSLNEFLERYMMGGIVEFRIKDCEVVEQSMLIGFQSSDDNDIPGDGYVLIGNCRYGLKELFNNYELNYLNKWQPFGVMEE